MVDEGWAADRGGELGMTAAFDRDLEEFQQRLFKIPEPSLPDMAPGPAQVAFRLW